MTGFVIAGAIGPWQIILIVALVILFFGGRKIPELMRGLGKGVGEFKKGMSEGDKEDKPNEDDKEEQQKN
jgi:sec-independent protein translocase protein TatA